MRFAHQRWSLSKSPASLSERPGPLAGLPATPIRRSTASVCPKRTVRSMSRVSAPEAGATQQMCGVLLVPVDHASSSGSGAAWTAVE